MPDPLPYATVERNRVTSLQSWWHSLCRGMKNLVQGFVILVALVVNIWVAVPVTLYPRFPLLNTSGASVCEIDPRNADKDIPFPVLIESSDPRAKFPLDTGRRVEIYLPARYGLGTPVARLTLLCALIAVIMEIIAPIIERIGDRWLARRADRLGA